MYESDWVQRIRALRTSGARTRLGVSRNVWFLGLTSLLTDVSSEMITGILPAYLVLQLGFGPIGFGIVDGLYHGLTVLARWAGGVAADRWRSYKMTAAAGYMLSAVCKLAWLAAGGVPAWLGLTLFLDRTGKAIRTAPRDALISLSTSRESLATAFGIHRTMDAAGAMLGPMVAFAVLSVARDAYDAVFVVSFLIAVLGVAALLLFVRNVPPEAIVGMGARPRLFAELAVRSDFRRLLLLSGAFSLVTVSDGFVYLILRERGNVGAHQIPLMFGATAACFVVLATPAGYLADRFGYRRLFLSGQFLLLIAYASPFLPFGDVGRVLACTISLGAFYAATDGVLAAWTSAEVQAGVRSTALAVLASVMSVGRLVGSTTFGAVWGSRSSVTALASFGVALLVVVIVGAVWLPSRRRAAEA